MRARLWLRVVGVVVALLGAADASAQSYTYAEAKFEWVEATAATSVAWTNGSGCSGASAPLDDDISPDIELGFTFRFGKNEYKSVRIQSNGRLQFENNFCGFGTQTLGPPPTYPYLYPDGLPGGSSADVSRTMRIYGADLDPSAGGKVYYQLDGKAPDRRFIVTWDSVPEFSAAGSSFTMQIVLHESGAFVYQYRTFDNPSKGRAQIGWMLDGSDYGLVPYDTVAAGGTAIRFTPKGAGSLASFDIAVGGASASTCAPKQIVVTARDGTGTTLTSYVGTIRLSTSTHRGDWRIVTGAGALDNGSANDGVAAYTFSSSDRGVVTLALSSAHADDLVVGVVDSLDTSTRASSTGIAFRDNAFVLTPDPIQVAGRPQSVGVALWRRDPTTGNCAIASGYAGSKPLDAWITRDALDPGGAAPSVGGIALPASAPARSASSNNVSLAFSAGRATLALATTDVGKYVLNLRDDTRAFASGVDILGASAAITTRPFALGFSEIKQGGGTCAPASGTATCNPGGTATAGAKFVAAGDSFQATIGGYLWSAADDLDNDGVPDAGANVTDNGLAPSFAWPTTLAATTPITPASGVTGALGGTISLAQGSFVGGRALASALTYAEVGSVTLRASATSYLGTAGADPTGTSPVVGRFHPGRFFLWPISSVAPACSAGGFSYMGQPGITVAVVIEAQTTSGTRTQNYLKPGYATGTVSMHAENGNDGTDLAARLGGVSVVFDWVVGYHVAVTNTASFGRANGPDGPFDTLQFGVRVTDPDGAVLTGRNMNPATAGDCAVAGNCTAVALGAPTRVRFGRLRVQSGSGSELLPLTVPVEAQYWNGTGFTRHTSDSCTTIPAGAVAIGAYTQRSGSVVSPAPTGLSMVAGPLSAGVKLLTLSAPGAGKGGDAPIVVNLGATAGEALCGADTFASSGAGLAWLRGRWCGANHDRDPTARITFGVRRASSTLVFMRENY